jgi:hypothetical protein
MQADCQGRMDDLWRVASIVQFYMASLARLPVTASIHEGENTARSRPKQTIEGPHDDRNTHAACCRQKKIPDLPTTRLWESTTALSDIMEVG